MKVLNEIIDYLFSKGIISQVDLEIFEAMGYYNKNKKDIYDDGYDYYDDGDDYIEDEESIYEDEMINIEKQLEVTRSGKTGKQNRIHREKKQLRNKRKKRETGKLVRMKNIWWAPPRIIVVNESFCNNFNFLYSMKGKSYSEVNVFWDRVKHIIDNYLIISNSTGKGFLDTSELIIEYLESSEEKRKKLKYIRPRAFYELKNSKDIECDGWKLKIKIDKDNFLTLTNEDGALIFKKQRI